MCLKCRVYWAQEMCMKCHVYWVQKMCMKCHVHWPQEATGNVPEIVPYTVSGNEEISCCRKCAVHEQEM